MIGSLLALFGLAMRPGAYSPAVALAGVRSYPYPLRAGKSGAAAKARNKRRARRA